MGGFGCTLRVMTVSPADPALDVKMGQFSENLNTLLFRVGITGTRLARELGMPQATISRKIRGATTWSLDEVFALLAFFAVQFEEMATVLPPREEWEDRDVPALRACRDSNPKPSDLYSHCPVHPAPGDWEARCTCPRSQPEADCVVDLSAYRAARVQVAAS